MSLPTPALSSKPTLGDGQRPGAIWKRRRSRWLRRYPAARKQRELFRTVARAAACLSASRQSQPVLLSRYLCGRPGANVPKPGSTYAVISVYLRDAVPEAQPDARPVMSDSKGTILFGSKVKVDSVTLLSVPNPPRIWVWARCHSPPMIGDNCRGRGQASKKLGRRQPICAHWPAFRGSALKTPPLARLRGCPRTKPCARACQGPDGAGRTAPADGRIPIPSGPRPADNITY
jgi:hypothetical protein